MIAFLYYPDFIGIEAVSSLYPILPIILIGSTVPNNAISPIHAIDQSIIPSIILLPFISLYLSAIAAVAFILALNSSIDVYS